MTRWGVGTNLFRFTLLYGKLAWLYDELLFSGMYLTWLAPEVVIPCGIILIVLGFFLYALAIPDLYPSYDAGQLRTRGIYGFLRHPMYAAWLLFIVPGIALIKGTVLFLTIPLASYGYYRRAIRLEERFLEERFGEAYQAYKKTVGAITPKLVRVPSGSK